MKVLLVRLSSMGDLIHTLPAIEDLARSRSDVELHWLCEAGFADIARLHPFVKRVHVLRWRQWRRQLGQTATWRAIVDLRRHLVRECYDWVLDSQGLMKSVAFSKMVNVPVKGFDSRSVRERAAAWFYNQTFFVQKGQDAVLRNRLLFAQAFSYQLPHQMRFGVYVPEHGHLANLVPVYHVVLHASSRDSKLWRQDAWLDLMQRLHQRDGSTIYLPWGNVHEKRRAEAMAANLPFVEVCPPMSLLQAAWLLQNAQSVIGVDTGLLHLANALGKPLVGIYTDTDPYKTGVQTSMIAQNIGGKGQMPSVDEVYALLMKCIAAADVIEG